jgi:hypothetical protein
MLGYSVLQVRDKRSFIAELIRILAEKQNPGKDFNFPMLHCHAEPKGGMMGPGDLEDEIEEDEVKYLETVKPAPRARQVKVRIRYLSYIVGVRLARLLAIR